MYTVEYQVACFYLNARIQFQYMYNTVYVYQSYVCMKLLISILNAHVFTTYVHTYIYVCKIYPLVTCILCSAIHS